jgi:hypothetical protein
VMGVRIAFNVEVANGESILTRVRLFAFDFVLLDGGTAAGVRPNHKNPSTASTDEEAVRFLVKLGSFLMGCMDTYFEVALRKYRGIRYVHTAATRPLNQSGVWVGGWLTEVFGACIRLTGWMNEQKAWKQGG